MHDCHWWWAFFNLIYKWIFFSSIFSPSYVLWQLTSTLTVRSVCVNKHSGAFETGTHELIRHVLSSFVMLVTFTLFVRPQFPLSVSSEVKLFFLPEIIPISERIKVWLTKTQSPAEVSARAQLSFRQNSDKLKSMKNNKLVKVYTWIKLADIVLTSLCAGVQSSVDSV